MIEPIEPTHKQIEEFRDWLLDNAPAVRGFVGRQICDMALAYLDAKPLRGLRDD